MTRPCPIAFHDLAVGGTYEMAEDGPNFKRGDLVRITKLTPGGPGYDSEIRAVTVTGDRVIVVSGASWFRATGTSGIVREFVVDVEGFGHVHHGMRVKATSPDEAIAVAYARCGIRAGIAATYEVES